MARRGEGLRALYGIVEAEDWEESEVVGDTGRFAEAAVEGLRSWWGDGWRLIEADCIAEVMFAAISDIFAVVSKDWKILH